MVLSGTIVNAVLIIIGSLIGRLLSGIPETMKNTIMNGIGIAVVVLGIQMGLQSDNFLIVIISIVAGAVIGELFRLEDKLNQAGIWIENKVGGRGKGNIAESFVTRQH